MSMMISLIYAQAMIMVVWMDKQNLKNVEPQKDQMHPDFDEISKDPILEEPCLEVDKRLKEYLQDEAPKNIIGKF